MMANQFHIFLDEPKSLPGGKGGGGDGGRKGGGCRKRRDHLAIVDG